MAPGQCGDILSTCWLPKERGASYFPIGLPPANPLIDGGSRDVLFFLSSKPYLKAFPMKTYYKIATPHKLSILNILRVPNFGSVMAPSCSKSNNNKVDRMNFEHWKLISQPLSMQPNLDPKLAINDPNIVSSPQVVVFISKKHFAKHDTISNANDENVMF